VENPLASTHHTHSISAHYKQKIAWKVLQSIQPWQKIDRLAHAPFIDLKTDVSLDPLCFNLLLALRTLWATFQVKNNVRNAPDSTTLTLVSLWSHNVHTTNHYLCGCGERNGEQKENKGKTVMQALEVLWSAKKHILG